MKTKSIILGLGLSVLSLFVQAQNGLENIFVERYYVTDATDAANSHPTLPLGSVTYRIYADMLPGYKVQSIYGSSVHSLLMNTSTYFFNNSDYGDYQPTFSATNARKNTVMLDSWLSTGGACNNWNGVPKSADNGINNFVNSNVPQLLQNNAALAGIPLTTQDGMLAGTVPSMITLGIPEAMLDILRDGSANGNAFLLTNGAWSCLSGAAGPDPLTNKVLIAQLTTDGIFHFELNIQIGTPTGGTQNYVWSNPTGVELTIPSLVQTLYPVLQPPTISITAPLNGAIFPIGTPVEVTAIANDIDGSISQVEFFVDGNSIGIDATAPYSAIYTGLTESSHVLTAKATDNDGQFTISDPVNITVAPQVTFNLDMSTATGFTPGTDQVYMAGNFPGAVWNEPGTNANLQMTQVGTTLIYTLTLALPSATYEYKYFKNAGWGGGEYLGGSNRSVVVAANATVNDTWGGSINWANLQWPASGTIALGGAFDVYAQAYIQNGVTSAAGVTTGLQAWIGYSTSNTDPSTWTDWVPAPFSGQSYDNDEFKSDLGSAITSAGTYYYASRFQYGSMPFVYGGFNGGFWNGTTNVSGVLTVEAPATKTLNVKAYFQGFWNGTAMSQAQDADMDLNTFNKFTGTTVDTLSVLLAEANTPWGFVFQAHSVTINPDGTMSVTVPSTFSGSYYIVIKQRNTVETWSGIAVDFSGSTINYDFTSAAGQAFGSNQKDLNGDGSVWGLYSGDFTSSTAGIKDEYVDFFDLNEIFNLNLSSASGYQPADLTGDGFVDYFDVNMAYNNNLISVGMNTPPNPAKRPNAGVTNLSR